MGKYDSRIKAINRREQGNTDKDELTVAILIVSNELAELSRLKRCEMEIRYGTTADRDMIKSAMEDRA